MSITIDPSSRKRKQATDSSLIGNSGGERTIHGNSHAAEIEKRKKDASVVEVNRKVDPNSSESLLSLVQADVRRSKKPLYGGPVEYQMLLDTLVDHIAGVTDFQQYGSDAAPTVPGARYGFIGHLARALPRPVLLDNEDVIRAIWGGNAPTMAVDQSGRMWVCSKFLHECLTEDQTNGFMTLPILNHEYLHVALEHCFRMKDFLPEIANIAQDIVINPMVKKMYPSSTKFSPKFLALWGNKEEDRQYENLSEEVIAKILQQKLIEQFESLGDMEIDVLEIVDGTVTQEIVHKAEKDEVLKLGHVVVTVEEIFDDQGNSIGDKVDTGFEFKTCTVKKTINNLKPRNRPNSGAAPANPEDHLIQIPTVSNKSKKNDQPDDQPSKSNNENKGNGDDPSNQQKENAEDGAATLGERKINSPSLGKDGNDPSNPFNNGSHLIDIDKLKSVLEAHGFGEMAERLGSDGAANTEERMQRVIEGALAQAEMERREIGNAYPGAHINDYMVEVVKPSLKYSVTWQQKLLEIIDGYGVDLTRSFEERSVLSMLDPEDLGFADGDIPEIPGIVMQKTTDRIAIIYDTSGSVDQGRLCEFVSFGLGIMRGMNDSRPDIDMVGADTDQRGDPIQITEDMLQDVLDTGIPLGGGGGTDFTVPLNRLMEYAERNDIRYRAIIYLTDFGCYAPPPEALPPNLPTLVFAGIPADYAAAERFRKGVADYADVVCIERNMVINADEMEARQERKGVGLRNL